MQLPLLAICALACALSVVYGYDESDGIQIREIPTYVKKTVKNVLASGKRTNTKVVRYTNATSHKQLRGINRSGSEFSCVEGKGIFDGPVDDASIKAMTYWYIDIIRIGLNEDCWLSMNGHNPKYSGDNYKNAIIDYVKRLRKHGLKVILELHWTDGIFEGDDYAAIKQKPMPNRAVTPKFWQSVANTFKNDLGVYFDLFNEPFPDRVMSDSTQAWKCLRDGGDACPGIQFEVAGMQELVNVVRKTGAKNKIMLPGLSYTNDLSRWMEFLPTDPVDNFAASWHTYDFNPCNYKKCWESTIAPLTKKYELIVGEIGQRNCKHDYIDPLMKWLDDRKITYLGWTWNTWDCNDGPSLISDYNGTPTEFGQGFKDHLYNKRSS